MKNEKIIVLDTETVNTLDDPLCYDVGFAVIDSKGRVLEKHSYIVSEIFFFEKQLMKDSVFANKLPEYWQDIKKKKRIPASIYMIKGMLWTVCERYNVKIIAAHNAAFDYRALNTTYRYISKSKHRHFFPYNVEIWDTLKMARIVFKNDIAYCAFCTKNSYITKNNQNRYTAEILYRFLTNDNSFVESHTGLEDVMIEKDIYLECLRKNPNIDGVLWKDIRYTQKNQYNQIIKKGRKNPYER